MGKVRIRHPKTRHRAWVPERAVPHYIAAGWAPVTDETDDRPDEQSPQPDQGDEHEEH